MTKHPDKDASRRILDFLKEHCGESYTAVEINVAVFRGDYAFWGAPGDVPLPEIKSALEALADGRMVERDGTRTLDRRVNLPGATTDRITTTEPSIPCIEAGVRPTSHGTCADGLLPKDASPAHIQQHSSAHWSSIQNHSRCLRTHWNDYCHCGVLGFRQKMISSTGYSSQYLSNS